MDRVGLRKSSEGLIEWLGAPQLWVGIASGIVLPIGGFLLVRGSLGRGTETTRTVNIPFGLGNMTYDLSKKERILSWHLFVQLRTRKAALPFDEDHDVITEVYDSLYELFPITRDLVMNLPLKEIEKQESVADLMLRVLNDGLRPHLTTWQAEFRRWWVQMLGVPANNLKRPQDLQKGFPQYGALVDDLKRMNVELNKFAEDLLVIAQARPAEAPRKRPVASPPSQDEQGAGNV